eukprot:TRINITY_DN4260_c0_g1_i6.p1 TRINITY_DN4260_c0_g1~~TRINITY_DN4260_c0_g1_i6.p1  ORF type:complete len:160 (-),score=22.55 TRINITY_DN4260_c0_g1_i6:211-690(-)
MNKENYNGDGQLLVKLLSVGDCYVGKSCLIKRYCEGKFVDRYITTIGVDYGVKKMMIKTTKVAVNFFDLSGDDDYKLIRKDFYSNSQGVLLAFSLDNKDSFVNLVKWENEMRENGCDPRRSTVIVVGCKSDVRAKVLPTINQLDLDIPRLSIRMKYRSS